MESVLRTNLKLLSRLRVLLPPSRAPVPLARHTMRTDAKINSIIMFVDEPQRETERERASVTARELSRAVEGADC